MNKLEPSKRFMVRQWEDLKKSGGLSYSVEQIEDILQGGEEKVLSRGELQDKVKSYFSSCMRLAKDEDSGELITVWGKNPTKSGLALALGIDKQTLLDYVKGINSANKPFSSTNPDNKRRVAVEDFDILRKAYTLIEEFYESKLGDNRNNAGVMYWLNNAHNSKWSNEQEFKFGKTTEEREEKTITLEELKGRVPKLLPEDEELYNE